MMPVLGLELKGNAFGTRNTHSCCDFDLALGAGSLWAS
jgi:hypothetical protein